jgi:hypothetical protein
VDVTLGEEQVPLVLGEDLGYPEAVSQDLDGTFEPRKLHYALQRRQRPAQESLQERSRCSPEGLVQDFV